MAERSASVVALCRAGFEPEAAIDLQRAAKHAAIEIDVRPEAGNGYVVAALPKASAARLRDALAAVPPVFARNAAIGIGDVVIATRTHGDRPDRVTPLVEAIDVFAADRAHAGPWRSVWVEHPDTNEGKAMSRLARALEARLVEQLSERDLLAAKARSRLHVFVTDGTRAFIGTSDAASTRWPLGIPRLARSRAAPSRSAQKLAEAFVVFLGDDERELVRAGQRAVDLGAAPGGWTWLLAQRGLRVTAVDNGALRGEVADDPLVTHVRADGLRYRPTRRVDWLTCDIVEQPSRIAEVAGGWIADGAARHAIFNLKLPMKRRFEALLDCEARIERRLARSTVDATLAFRQLYHDREEVTGYLAVVG